MKLTWNDITVGDQLRIREIGNLQMASDDEKNMMVAALVAEMPYEDLLMMPLNKVREIMDATDFLLHPPVPEKARRKYEINGRTYKLFKNPADMTVAQFIDFQYVHREGYDKMPAEMLSVFLVPDGHQYNDGYDKEQQLDDMLDLSVTEALGICDFFTGRCLKSIRQMGTFSGLMMKAARILAPREKKEEYKALELQMKLIQEALAEEFGSLASKQYPT